MFEAHISKHSSFRLKITVGCLTSTYPSIHVGTPSRSRSVDWCVGCVCTCGVVCGVGGVCCFVVVVRVCVVCGEAWHTLSLSCSLSFLFYFPFAFPFFFFLIFIFSLLFLFLFLLLLLLLALALALFLSPLLATKQYGKNRSTNTVANIEAFECDLAQGKCTAVGSLPPPLPSLPPFSPSHPQKKKGNFLLQEYFRR